jgi:hypothetical protein
MTGFGGALFMVVMFFMFFSLSCIILIIMEGVSAMVSPPHLWHVPSCVKANVDIASLASACLGRVVLEVR